MSAINSPKLLLFDIDGTLISTNGVAGKIMLEVLQEEIHQSIEYDIKVFVGSTDRLILRQFIEKTSVPIKDIDIVIDKVLMKYLSELETKLFLPNKVKMHNGVLNLLERLIDDEFFKMGLLTGNIKAGAHLKLGAVNLGSYFPIGAFGDDAIDRNSLPPIAINRAEKYFGTTFPVQNVWIIGDSPRDIICANSNGLRSMAVASGWNSIEELKEYNPDILLNDLADTDRIIEIFKA
jgi:phosphoglycolate phosphatase-like HAD superfamily hydrolase